MSEATTAESISVTVLHGHARVELNRPARRNAVDVSVVRELSATFTDLRDRQDVRVVTLSGRGPSFCAGADIGEFSTLAAMTPESREEVFAEHMSMLDALDSLPQVTIAVPHGMTAGLGISLVSRCDVAVAASSAQFGLPELSLGIVPALVLVDVQRVMTAKTANDWLLLGGRRSAEEALRAGLVSRVVDDEMLASEISEMVATLLAVPGGALRRTVELSALVADGDAALVRRLAIVDSAAGIASQEAQQGTRAFLPGVRSKPGNEEL